MKRVFEGIARLWSHGSEIRDAAMVEESGRLLWVGPREQCPPCDGPRTQLGGRSVVPALVDCHTHLVFGGDRFGEARARGRGASYEEILAAGGGIHATVQATRALSLDELHALSLARLQRYARGGVGTVEIKSGYGLDLESELRMLQVIARLAGSCDLCVLPTLLAHVVPRQVERQAWLRMFVEELMPEVARQKLAVAVDVFCDSGAFTLQETRHILERAQLLGFEIKAHAEQLSHSGASSLVAELGGLSADHLEQATPEDWQAMARAGVIGVLLPGAAFLLRKPFPPARAMLQHGMRLALASDFNPGSSPMPSLVLALQMATILGQLDAEEVMLGGTLHAAQALGRQDAGRLEPGCRADFLVLEQDDPLALLYYWGDPGIQAIYLQGRLQT